MSRALCQHENIHQQVLYTSWTLNFASGKIIHPETSLTNKKIHFVCAHQTEPSTRPSTKFLSFSSCIWQHQDVIYESSLQKNLSLISLTKRRMLSIMLYLNWEQNDPRLISVSRTFMLCGFCGLFSIKYSFVNEALLQSVVQYPIFIRVLTWTYSISLCASCRWTTAASIYNLTLDYERTNSWTFPWKILSKPETTFSLHN